ncbi:MAG: 50S ribosomal protein L10 [Microgenomates group bacterium GW2011_GWF2_45_18]|nr:MAG: 50S ribosomal protein L10 [Microgenomates group bacterium GW2011_GWF1_44_10]KKU01352.1 MAG: 50S ribosomal protein L10 [Microgenomates group bacterium GW2011_GWF2_45_18]HAU99372.1 50S ribosomal protein L10 [Candidatus Paceibacterota bacterium]HAX01350.1 50S ribosomal protein L10 [Candidatus Paceibacterota bacterium]
MPNTKNVSQLADVKEKFAKSKSVVIANYSGLSVNQQTKLRAELREAGGEFVVAKNTIVRIALKKDELNHDLEGQSGVLFSYEDEVSALKKLVEFAKKFEKPVIKSGLMQDKVLSYADVMELSKLPSKVEMFGQLLGSLQSPARGLVTVLTGNTRNLVYALDALRKKLA